MHGAVSIFLALAPGHSVRYPAVPIRKPSWPLEAESWQHCLLDGGWASLQEHALAFSTISKLPEAGGRDSYLLLRANEGAINCPFSLETAEKPQPRLESEPGHAVRGVCLGEYRCEAVGTVHLCESVADGEGNGEGKETATKRAGNLTLGHGALGNTAARRRLGLVMEKLLPTA